MSHLVNIFQYQHNKPAIEYFSEKKPQNYLVFIAGLCDGFLCTKFIPKIAELFNKELDGSWAMVETLISSSYIGFGTGSLKRDARELGQLVKYLRTVRGSKDSKVVLIGHSTGCQDIMEYLTKFSYEDDFEEIMRLDGGILQAALSDTEAAEKYKDANDLKLAVEQAERLIEEGKADFIINDGKAKELAYDLPMTAYRFHSLYARRTDDDYFSSYLTQEDHQKTFARVKAPLLILIGAKDEYLPSWVDPAKLIEEWKQAIPKEYFSTYSKVVEGSDHKGEGPHADPGAADDIAQTVLKFIKSTY